MNQRQIAAGAALGLGGILAAPAAAQADDFTVTNLNDDGAGSLREAIDNANADADADRILFKSKLSGTITLGPTLSVSEPVQIIGPGPRRVTVDGNGGPVLQVVAGSGEDVGVTGLRLDNGASLGGAAIAVGSADLNLSKMAITNSYAGNGGGIFSSQGNVTIENSTVSGNRANGVGGGIFVREGDLTILNSTISGNTAGQNGGGVYVYNDTGSSPSPAVEVRNSTVSRNEAGFNAGGGGLFEIDVSETEIRGSIIAGNTDGNGSVPDLDDGPWNTSFSLIGDTSGAIIDDQGGNVLDVDPKLKPLKDNGGPTDTHAFKKSPAKNKGPSDAPNSDQRGAPRKGKPDIGAYELTKCEGVIVNRVGTAGKDKLKGTKRKDGILGLGGNDKLSGKKGKDGLCGGQGKDKLKGGPGKDKLNGGPGKDKEIQ